MKKVVDRGLIVQFGGLSANVYKFKPPLTTPISDFELMLEISQEMAAFIQDRVHDGRRKVVRWRTPSPRAEPDRYSR